MLMNIRIAFNNSKPVKLLSKKVYHYFWNSEGCIRNYKGTIAYEDMYNRYRLASIPQEFIINYKKELIDIRIKSIKSVMFFARQNTWAGTEFYEQLINDIEEIHYHLPLKTKILLNLKSPVVIKLLTLPRVIKSGLKKFMINSMK